MASVAVGVILALATCGFGTATGMDRDRAFYAEMTIVVASYYGLFAVLGESPRALALESIVMAGFLVAAILGFKRNPWILAVALAGHGLFDSVHGHIIANPGLPEWWPAFCAAFDVTAGGYLAWLLRRRGARPAAS
jgi:hypothetical protein